MKASSDNKGPASPPPTTPIDLTIVPKQSLGKFKLHSKLSLVLSELHNNAEYYGPTDIVITPYPAAPIYLYAYTQGLKFRFHGPTQTLEMIEILFGENQKLSRTSVLYLNKENLNQAKESRFLLLEYICTIMGEATEEYTYVSQDKYILLKYPGISFLFENLSGKANNTLKYVNKCKLWKIALFHADNIEESIGVGRMIPMASILPAIEVVIGKGINLLLSDSGKKHQGTKSIYFGDELDYVLSVLKNPQKIYTLSMHDHNQDPYYRWNKAQDIVLNYFSIGFDLIIQGDTHKLKKIIIHTNQPGHPKFNIHDRCMFYIQNPEVLSLQHAIEMGPSEETKMLSSTSSAINPSTIPLRERVFGPLYINGMSEWGHVKQFLHEEKIEDEVTYLRNWTKYLVKTMYYARKGCIFEISAAGAICSLTLFQEASKQKEGS